MKKSKKKHRKWPYILLSVVGCLILMYPIFSRYNRVKSNHEIVLFNKAARNMEESEVIRRIELARGYNETLDSSRLSESYRDKKNSGAYARMLELEGKIGYVEIPKMDMKLPIAASTSKGFLQREAGHLEGTSLPIGGKSTHGVITIHRGFFSFGFFRHLNKLSKGDVFYVHNLETTLAYEVDQIVNVEPFDFKPVLVVDGEDYVTLLSDTPYGMKSHRLLVRGHRIPYVAPVDDDDFIRDRIIDGRYRDFILFEFPVAFVVFVLLMYYRWEANRRKKILQELKRAREKGSESEQE